MSADVRMERVSSFGRFMTLSYLGCTVDVLHFARLRNANNILIFEEF